MTDGKLQILVLTGTVRENRKSIRPARYITTKLEERGHEAELFDMAEKEIPMLENTAYHNGPTPEPVEEYGSKAKKADGLLIVTPEYNHSIPGALKNLLDYLYEEYTDKPFCYVTVSAGNFGGVRALNHLHDITIALGGKVGPNLPVSDVENSFGENSKPSEEYRERVRDYLDELEDFVSTQR